MMGLPKPEALLRMHLMWASHRFRRKQPKNTPETWNS